MNLPPIQQEEIVSELAVHLEDLYQEQLAAGLDEPRAMQQVLSAASDWNLLANRIERAKRQGGIVNSRTRQFWIPAIISLTASMGWMMLLQIASAKLTPPWRHSGLDIVPYAIWFITLPLIGGVSGRLSDRAGSRRTARIAAVTFPSIVMSALWIVLLAVVLARRSPQPFQTLNFAYGFMLWVIAPAAALLAGTIPLSRRETAHT